MTAAARQRAPWREQDWPLPRPATQPERETELQAHRKRLRRAGRSVWWRYRLRGLRLAQRVVVPLPRPGGRMGEIGHRGVCQEYFMCAACYYAGRGGADATGVVVSYGDTQTGCCDAHDPSRRQPPEGDLAAAAAASS